MFTLGTSCVSTHLWLWNPFLEGSLAGPIIAGWGAMERMKSSSGGLSSAVTHATGLSVLEEAWAPLVEILLSFLTPGGNRLRNQICEVLDTDLIRQQAEHSTVDIQGLSNYVISTMGKLCAPVRDDDIRELKATGNVVEVLRTCNLKEVLNSIGVQTCVEVNKTLMEKGLPALNAEVQANLIGQFSNIEEEDNPIWSLIEKRIQLYMKSLLCLPSPQKCMPPVPGGLTVIQQELEVLGCQYANIVNLNKQVYGPFYANILRKLLFGVEALRKAEASSSTN
ncbi:hypothetical protein CB1_002317008 [Camelus ferus]|nr:hypothetical protein CB1_002317008 [Camelus ferus]